MSRIAFTIVPIAPMAGHFLRCAPFSPAALIRY
jgi:hypothetical protein